MRSVWFDSIVSINSSFISSLLHLLFILPLLLSNPITPLQSEVLIKLGLPSIPNRSSSSIPIPNHIWDLYQEAQQGQMDEDSLRLFYPNDLIDLNAGLLLSYNLSLEVQKERAVSAELKLKVKGGEGRAKVYRVNHHKRLRVEKLLDSVEMDKNVMERLLDFDVSEGIDQSNHHLIWFLVVLPDEAELETSESPSLSSIPMSRKSSASLVVRYINDDDDKNEHPKRRKRSTSEERKGHKKGKGQKKHRIHKKKGLCRIKSMYVDFKELNWHDWIIAPNGYDAHQCIGNCSHPLPDKLNSTNHAIIQGLISTFNPEIPPPCCAPIRLSPLVILYRDMDNHIVMKSYPDMIVTECGCV